MNTPQTTARLASLIKIRDELVPLYITPCPSIETLRDWFDNAQIPRFKSNPTAKRGGGPCFYSVSAVEKLLKSRTLPKMGKAAV